MSKDQFTFLIIPEITDAEFNNPKRYNVYRQYDYEIVVAVVSYDWDGTGFRIRYNVDLPRPEQDRLVEEAKTLGRWLFKPDL